MSNNNNKPRDSFNKFLLISIGFHLLIILIFNVKTHFFPSKDLIIGSSVRVDMVALPDKIDSMKKATQKLVSKNKKKTKKKKVKKKKIKKKKPKKKNPKVNLKKQQSAIEKLKAEAAIERLRKLEEEKASEPEETQEIEFKGNRLSSGTQLEGLSQIQFERYYDELKAKLYESWSIPQWLSEGDYKAQALVSIDANGNVTAKSILTSSGNEVFDNAVFTAIDNANPFPPPPDRLKSLISGKEIVFVFP